MFRTMDFILKKDTPIPVEMSREYKTIADNQPRIRINILQGESKKAKENHSLGTFIIKDIPPGQAGS